MAHHVAVAVEDGGGDSAATDFGSAGGCHGRNRNDHGCHNRCQRLGLGTRLCPAATILAVAGELSAACCLSFSLPWFTSLHLCHRLPRCRLLPMSLEPSLAQLAPASRRHPTTAPSTEAAALDFLPVRSGVASPRFVIVELIPRRIRAPAAGGRLRRIRARRLFPGSLPLATGSQEVERGKASRRRRGLGGLGNPEVKKSGIALAGSLIAVAKCHEDC